MTTYNFPIAFVCDICGRRFSVLSNLNRHAKRCPMRPVNLTKTIATTNPANTSSSDQVTEGEIQPGPSSEVPRGRKRKSATQDPTKGNNHPQVPPAKPKRSRRAPSPSSWVPGSLRHFDLTPQTNSAPMPLPPVHPYGDVEERDSFDENVDVAPYHPQGWKGRLPGPGVMERDIANTNGGRILVF